MPITVKWDNPQHTIIQFDFDGEWTWDELEAATDQATGLLDSADRMVDFVMDLRGAKQVPGDLMSHAERIAGGHHPRRGAMVVVGANGLLRTLSGGLRKLFPEATRNVLFAADLEEAYEIIASRQASGQ